LGRGGENIRVAGLADIVYLEKSDKDGWSVLGQGVGLDTHELGIPDNVARDLHP